MEKCRLKRSSVGSEVTYNSTVPLYDDETLYIVPGSHRRELADAERAVIQQTPKAAMPNQLVVKLEAGDIIFLQFKPAPQRLQPQ